jgi:glycosyltransferase-like protein LARGE
MHPINYLRNVALDNVVTPFVFLSDIDFVPNPKLYTTLQNYVQQMKLSTGKKVIL